MKKLLCLCMALVLLMSCVFIAAPAESAGEDGELPDLFPFSGESGMNFPTLTKDSFDADDIPEDYMAESEHPGRVEKVYYTTTETAADSASGVNDVVRSVMVYLPADYDASDREYNILYLLHASGGAPTDYLDRDKRTVFQNILDNMIANGDMEPIIVAAVSYFPANGITQFLPLEMQVNATSSYPQELAEVVIPVIEGQYRTYGSADTPEEITASRDHRAIAGFSMGGVVTWYTFIRQMQAFRWFLPISEASWDDGEGGTTGILDSDLSAQVLYNAVLGQGYGKEDFMLFVATGSDDIAFEISTNQMKSLLEYSDLFMPGENTSCSMMLGGVHSLQASFTYLYHIMPALFVQPSESTQS